MKIFKKLGLGLLILLALSVAYLLLALVLGLVPVNSKRSQAADFTTIFLASNGVHLDLVLTKEDLSDSLRMGLELRDNFQFVSFGWGDEDFYLNTPTWADLSLGVALNALFLNSSTLVHITEYTSPSKNWAVLNVDESQLRAINQRLNASFLLDGQGNKQLLENQGYGYSDDFYRARGSYSCFYTCNTWVNHMFKASGLKAAVWTPFDFGVMQHYR
ncbi:MAG: TIGR02117 family protein [Bacteroidota bacterium]